MVLQALIVSGEEGYEQVAPQEQSTSHLAREYMFRLLFARRPNSVSSVRMISTQTVSFCALFLTSIYIIISVHLLEKGQ